MWIFIKRAIICLLAGTAAGILLLVAVFALPAAAVLENVRSSAGDLFAEGEKSTFLQYVNNERESFTDAIILGNAIAEPREKGIFERAMMIYRYDLEPESWSPEETLLAISQGRDTDSMYLIEYSRYWHGYLVFVKPLLLIFTWRQLLIFGAVLQLALLGAILCISVKKGRGGVGVAVITGYALMKPVLMAASVTMSIIWILTQFILIYMLIQNERLIAKKRYSVLFLVVGMTTAYVDLLTYPVVSLGFPLCAYFLLNEKDRLGDAIKKLAGFSFCWGAGYIGIWGMKWVVADLTLHQGTIRDAVWTIIGRTESIGGRPRLNGAGYAIWLNLQEYSHPLYLWLMAIIVSVSLLLVGIVCRRVGIKETLKSMLPFLVIFAIPFVWILVAQNHSALHSRFTFRILGTAFMAVGCMGIRGARELIKDRNAKQEEKQIE